MSEASVTLVQGPSGPDAEVDVLGIRVSAASFDRTLKILDRATKDGTRGYVCVTGAHGVIESQSDPALKRIHNAAFLVVPDGMPLVWVARLSGIGDAERVSGPDLMPALIALGVRSGKQGLPCRHFLYGSTPETLERLEARLRLAHPGVEIVGSYSPPFRALSAEEQAEIAERINAAQPQIVWVGLSTPKQERWMSEFRPRLEANLLIGVGAAFDYHAGKLKRAPRAFQRLGLEWFFRLCMEPRRLWRRYLGIVPRFIYFVLAQKIFGRNFS